MPYDVTIPIVLRKAGWRVKVFDDEGPEVPHVTIRFRTARWWRVSLRDPDTFLIPGGRWRDIPPEIRMALDAQWDACIAYWDQQNPNNPVWSDGND